MQMRKFPVLVASSTHRDFKTICAAKGTTMSAVIRDFLERQVAAAGAIPKVKPKVGPAESARLEGTAA